MDVDKPEVDTVSTKTHLKRYLSFRSLLIINILAFSVLTFFAKTNPYFSFDLKITQSLQSINNPIFDTLMKTLTAIGNFEAMLILIVLACGILLFYKKFPETQIVFISAFGSTILTGLLKTFVARPRPDPSLISQIYRYNDPSFPSGHVLFAIGFYGIILFLSFTKLKSGLLRNFLITVSLSIIILMSFSRVYLGAHWFSDTLGSYLIGSVWLYLMILLYQQIKKHRVS